MSAVWNQAMEDVFHSEGISDTLSRAYPRVYKLMREELESTAAYLNLAAKSYSIEYLSPVFQGISSLPRSNSTDVKRKQQVNNSSEGSNDLNLVSESVEKQLGQVLSAVPSKEVGDAIANECLKALPLMNGIPSGGHYLVTSRANSIIDSSTNTLIWSVGDNLRLRPAVDDSTSRSPVQSSSSRRKEAYVLEGTLTVYTLSCNTAVINNLEKRATQSYAQAKEDILVACPREPVVLEPERQSITGKRYSVSQMMETSQTQDSKTQTREEALLQKSMAKTHDCVVTILEVKVLNETESMARDIVVRAMKDIKSHIDEQLQTLQETFVIGNHLVVVYSFNNLSPVRRILEPIQSQRNVYSRQTSRGSQSTRECIIELQHVNTAVFGDVMRRIGPK